MARAPVPVGSYGAINYVKLDTGWRAETRVRDADGGYRRVKRNAATKTKAENALKKAIQERAAASNSSTVAATAKLRSVGKLWLAGVENSVRQGDLEVGTLEQYQRNFDLYVAPGLGELRIRELNVARADAFIQDVRLHHGSATARISRTVLSGILGLATRHGALSANPIRDVGRITSKRKKKARSLTIDERTTWLAQLDADKQAVKKDLPDLCCFMLGTGVRIGEALAVSWEEIDLDTATVEIDWILTRAKGAGLLRKPSSKTEAGERTLPLPAFVVEMLERRKAGGVRETSPLFADARGGWRDPSNTRRDLRRARGTEGFAWVTSHTFRKTCATILDDAGLSARRVADQLGHARPSMTQDVYMGRTVISRDGAHALDRDWCQAPARRLDAQSGP